LQMSQDPQEIRKKLEALFEKRKSMQESLGQLEVQIYKFETNYLDETSEYGNICKGWDREALSAPINKSEAFKLQRKLKKNTVKDWDRLFSSSSVSSPLSLRQAASRAANAVPSSSPVPAAAEGGDFEGPSSNSRPIKEEEIDDYDHPQTKKKRRK
ncbi:hypothetical protein PENTCL1PPCAC_25085, partial [Pristionchus entomophagus]